jgi:hypothetical protein
MKIAKYVLMAAVLVSVFGMAAFAGAPAPTTEQPKAEQVTPPPPPPEPSIGTADPSVISTHFTVGLGFGGSPIIGFVDKDGINYPRDEYGLISGIGFGYTWFSGYPSIGDMKAAVRAVKRSNPGISESDVPTKAREMLGVNHLTYVELGILNAEMGYEWLLTDNLRTRLGIGLPTLISVGINLDF